MNETGIVKKAKEGDAGAFEKLYERYKHFVWSVAYRMTYDFDTAEDLAQEVFVSAWKALKSFRGESAFSTWLYRITVNKTLNRLRARPPFVTYDSSEPALTHVDVDKEIFIRQNPRAAPEAMEAEQDLANFLSRLDPDRRVAVVLREIEGLSYEEIAEATGAPIGTVRSRIARARSDLEKLAAEMEETK